MLFAWLVSSLLKREESNYTVFCKERRNSISGHLHAYTSKNSCSTKHATKYIWLINVVEISNLKITFNTIRCILIYYRNVSCQRLVLPSLFHYIHYAFRYMWEYHKNVWHLRYHLLTGCIPIAVIVKIIHQKLINKFA